MSARLNRSEEPQEMRAYNSLRPSVVDDKDTVVLVPHVPEPLLGYLNKVYPDSLQLVERMGLEQAKGARHVIEHLRQIASLSDNVLLNEIVPAAQGDGPRSPASASRRPAASADPE